MLVLAQACTLLMKYVRALFISFCISGVISNTYLHTLSNAKDCRLFTGLYGGILIKVVIKSKIIQVKIINYIINYKNIF